MAAVAGALRGGARHTPVRGGRRAWCSAARKDDGDGEAEASVSSMSDTRQQEMQKPVGGRRLVGAYVEVR